MSGFFIQGRHGTRGNFEVVVPTTHGAGLTHLWRNNDVPSFPWSAANCFGSGDPASACLIQGNFGTPGNLEVVARDGDRLVFYWRMDRAPWTWRGPLAIAGSARGNPALIQSRHGTKGNFELIAAHAAGGLVHLWRNNDNPSFPWSAPFGFGSGNVTGVSLIQGNFGTPGNLEVVAVEGDRLVFYWRMDRAPWTWAGPFHVAGGVRGVPSLIQGRHGARGNFEVVAAHRDGGLVHLWRNNDIPSFPWSAPLRFGSGLYDEVTLVQGNFGTPGNLEVVARRADGQLDFYWRLDRSPWTWNGPFLIGAERSRDVSECVYGWRSAFFQSDSHIVARIQLNPDAGISADTMNTLRTTWRNGIIDKWSDRFDCQAPNGERRRITFDVHWVASNAHHVVRVRPGPERSNMTTWDTSDSADVASHEFGHMMGHPDEYADAACPSRNPVNTGTVMADNTEVVERLMETFANFHCGHDATPRSASEPTADEEVPSMRPFEWLTAEERSGFVERLRSVVGAEGTAGDAKVVLVVSGGAPGDRFEYRAEVAGGGRGEVRVLDEISGRQEENHGVAVEAAQVARLFELAASDEVLNTEHPAPRFVPDSLVGTLVVTDGDAEKRIHFAVDSESGRVRPPAEGDIAFSPADAGLVLRQEYTTPGVRSLVETIQSIQELHL